MIEAVEKSGKKARNTKKVDVSFYLSDLRRLVKTLNR